MLQGFQASLTRRRGVGDAYRGLKSTATLTESLRDCKQLNCARLFDADDFLRAIRTRSGYAGPRDLPEM